MFKKVLVLAANGDSDQPSLRRALASVDDAGEIEVFDVVYEPALEGYMGNTAIYEPLRSRVLRERRERADVLASSVEARGVRASANAVWGHPLHAAVAKEIGASAADLFVFAAAHGADRGLAHSEWQLVLASPAPVLVVKSDGVAKYRNVVAAVDPFHAHAKPADLDAAILADAAALAGETGAKLTVLHCYAPVGHLGADLASAMAPSAGGAHERAVRELVAAAGLPASAVRIVAGAPHSVLHALIESGDADLVVMGALARGRFAELVVGHTAERVLHESRADVLVVKPGAPTERR